MIFSQSRKIVQIICKELYGHDLYLSPEDQAEGEGTEISEEEMANSSIKDRANVFPSARTISDHKQLLASETESEAAMALLDKDSTIKAIVHFDTTSRNNIDAEWPTIILRFILAPNLVLQAAGIAIH